MIRKQVLVALGVVGGAAMLAMSAPSYSEDTLAAEEILQINQIDEQAQQDWTAPGDETAQAESDAEDMTGVAGRRADDMADEGPAGRDRSLDEGATELYRAPDSPDSP